MGLLAVRFYLFADDGLKRISHRLMDGLARAKDAIPPYAGTKHKVANVVVEMDGGKSVRIGMADRWRKDTPRRLRDRRSCSAERGEGKRAKAQHAIKI